MPVSTPDRSIRDLLLVVVLQLGICVVLLAEIANATRGYETGTVSIGQLVGWVTVVAALLVLFVGSKSEGDADDVAE